jgi:hypothetical protein
VRNKSKTKNENEKYLIYFNSLGAGRQSSRQAQRRIVDQIMIISAEDENHSNGNQFCKDIETNSVSEDGSSCTGRIFSS